MVIHKSEQMTVMLPTPIIQKGIIFMFLCYLVRTTDGVEYPRCLSPHGEFLDVLRYNFEIFNLRDVFQYLNRVGLYLVTLYIYILGVVAKSIYMLIFLKHIQGLSGVVRSFIF